MPGPSDSLDNDDLLKVERIKKCIRSYPDFPKKGIIFRDFLPIFRDPDVFSDFIDVFVNRIGSSAPQTEAIIGLESRGFLFGPLIALKLRVPFIPIRKAGKLPGELKKGSYELEYGNDTVEVQTESVRPGLKCVLVDDLLATGGSMGISIQLIKDCGATVLEALVVIELVDLKGRDKFNSVPVYSMIKY